MYFEMPGIFEEPISSDIQISTLYKQIQRRRAPGKLERWPAQWNIKQSQILKLPGVSE